MSVDGLTHRAQQQHGAPVIQTLGFRDKKTSVSTTAPYHMMKMPKHQRKSALIMKFP